MPAAAPIVAASIAGSAVAGATGGTIGGSAFAAAVASAAASAAAAYAASEVVGLNDRSSSIDELYGGLRINAGKADEPIPIIYGEMRAAGPLAYRNAFGGKNQSLWMVICWSEGEIESIDDIYFDTRRYSEMDEDDDKNIEQLLHHMGADDQFADTKMVTQIPEWSAEHRLQGIAYSGIKLRYDVNTWKTGLPVISAIIKGVKCYDPRDGVTRWTANPSLILLDYLMSERYGRGVPFSKIDEPSFIASANYCDEKVTYPNGKQYTRYSCNIAINPTKTLRQNALAIASSCRGIPVYQGGVWYFHIDRPGTFHSLRLDDDVMVGNWQIELGQKANRVNKVIVSYLDEKRKYEPYQVIVKSGAMLSEDSGVVNSIELPLPGTTSRRDARRIASQELKQFRQSKMISGRCTLAALDYAVGSVVQVDSALNGWNGKPFRVNRMDLNGDDTVSMECVEYDTSVYTLNVDDNDDFPETEFHDPFKTTKPKNLTITAATDELLIAGDGSILSRMLATWDYNDEKTASVLYTEVRWRNPNDQAWVYIQTDDLSVYLQPVADLQSYDVQARSYNIAGMPSQWTSVERVLVEGKTAPPRKPTGFRVVAEPDGRKSYEWNDTERDKDWSGWQLYYSGGSTFSAALKLNQGLVTDSPYLADLPYSGIWYFWITQVDTSGNESEPRQIGPVNLVGVQIGNSLYQSDARALGWPGTLSGGEISGNIVVAIDTGTWADLATDSVTWANWDFWGYNPASSFIYTHPAVDLGSSQTVASSAFAEGSDDLTIEVRHSADGAAWSAWAVPGGQETDRHFQFRITAATVASSVAYINSATFFLVE
jgi:hypothetical protein